MAARTAKGASRTSKTARASSVSGRSGPKRTDEQKISDALRGQLPRLVPLARGRFCYYFDPLTDRCLHLDTSSDAFVDALRPACSLGLAPAVERDLRGFVQAHPEHGWDRVIARLRDEQVLSAG